MASAGVATATGARMQLPLQPAWQQLQGHACNSLSSRRGNSYRGPHATPTPAGVATAAGARMQLPLQPAWQQLQGHACNCHSSRRDNNYRGTYACNSNSSRRDNSYRDIYRGRPSVVDVPRLQTESGKIAPTSPSALSHSAWSSAPWGLLRYPREPNNLLPLKGHRVYSARQASEQARQAILVTGYTSE